MLDETQNTVRQDVPSPGFGNTSIETKGLVERAKGILLSPKTEWTIIAAETPDTGKIIMGYVFPLALLSAIASFIGYGFVSNLYGGVMAAGIAMGLISFISTFLTVILAAAVVNMLAGTFNSRSDFGRAIQLVVYSYTPVWIAGILNIFPPLALITWVGMIYSIYLFYLGLPQVMQTPKEKVVGYMIVAAIVMIVVSFVLGLILMSTILGIFGVGLATMGRIGTY